MPKAIAQALPQCNKNVPTAQVLVICAKAQLQQILQIQQTQQILQILQIQQILRTPQILQTSLPQMENAPETMNSKGKSIINC